MELTYTRRERLDMSTHEIKIITRYDKDQIRQEVRMDEHYSFSNIVEQVMFLKDEGVKEALIKLGWTPPAIAEPNSTEPKEGEYTCCECGKKTAWLAPDTRCGACTDFTPEEIRGD